MADLEPLAGIAQDESLEVINNVLVRLLDALGGLSADALMRLRVNVEAGTVTIASGTVTTVTTVTTVATLTNQTNIGGLPANQHIPILNLLSEEQIRRNIVIS
jgi:hypothetical protein